MTFNVAHSNNLVEPESCGSKKPDLQGSKKWFAEHDKHYPSRSGQTSLATAVANITKPVKKNNFGPSML